MMQHDEEIWRRKFYDGTLLIKGWKSRMKEMLQTFHPHYQDAIRFQLEELGYKISREWIKDNRLRRIDTAMLQQWGDDMIQARRKGAAVLAKEINRIEKDVDEVLTA